MLKRISAFILALTMLCVTACSDDNSSDMTKAESSSSVSEQTSDSSSDDSSEEAEASSSQTETTTTASETTTTSETTTETKASDDSSASDTTTTKATADAKTTTTQASAGSKTTTKAITTTTKTTTTTTTKKTTTTTKATQPATQKTALDLAYEAVVKCNPTRAQLDLITKDLNNYVKSKGFCTKSVLDTSFYPFEKNGKPTFDINGSTGFGNCGFYEGFANDRAASAYYEGTKTLEQAREFYKKELKEHIDFMMNMINATYKERKKNGSESTEIKYNVMIYKDCTNPMQRFDLKLKYPNFRNYTMTIGYEV